MRINKRNNIYKVLNTVVSIVLVLNTWLTIIKYYH